VRGNLIAAVGMSIAVAATLVMIRHTESWPLIIAGLVVGVVLGVPPARLTKMTAMPQLVAFFNGVGGGTVALIALAEFIDTSGFSAFQHNESPTVHIVVASLFAAIIGSISFWGSIIAFGKLQEIISGSPIGLGKAQQPINLLLLAAAIVAAVVIGVHAPEFEFGKHVDDPLVELHHDNLFHRGMLQSLLCRSAIPAPDDQYALGSRVRCKCCVHQGLVIHELLALGAHEATIQPEELAELRCLVDLEVLEARLGGLDELGGAQEESVVLVQPLVHEALVSRHVVLHVLLGTINVHQVGDHLARLGAVVLGVIADVDVEGDALELGPGVDGEMRLRQHHCAGDSATVELVEQVAEYREAGPVDGVVTKTTQPGCVS